jgi:hypothetical protein
MYKLSKHNLFRVHSDLYQSVRFDPLFNCCLMMLIPTCQFGQNIKLSLIISLGYELINGPPGNKLMSFITQGNLCFQKSNFAFAR